jgi:hypothetical protein
MDTRRKYIQRGRKCQRSFLTAFFGTPHHFSLFKRSFFNYSGERQAGSSALDEPSHGKGGMSHTDALSHK